MPPRLRSVLLFMLGAGILVYETVHEHADRPELLIAAVTCLGLPTMFKIDRGQPNGKNDKK